MSAAGLSIEPALAPAAYDVVHEALEGERCVILDGGTAGGRARVSADALALHRRYVRAGCDGGPEQIGAPRAALAGRPRGAPRPGAGGPHELGGAQVAPPEPWVDATGPVAEIVHRR